MLTLQLTDPPFHPLANLFPLAEGAALAALAADIKAHGLLQPIVRYQGAILDGRSRYRACLMAGVAPYFQDLAEVDPVACVITANIRRRHQNGDQRALVAARLIECRRRGHAIAVG